MTSHKGKLWRVHRNLSAGGLTINQLRERTGYSEGAIRNYLRALESNNLIEQKLVDNKKKIWTMKDDSTK